MKHLFYSSYTI